MALERVVVVGGSLAGLRAAEGLRTNGFEGTITVVGEESHRPYDRPPLSKQVLAGAQPPESTELGPVVGSLDDLDIEWQLGRVASSLDPTSRTVLLGGGERLRYDGLVIATGASAKRLPGTDHLLGVHTLRTLDDCEAIAADLAASPRRVAVVGAGFIGAEVAATCRGLGLEVSLIEALAVPLERGLGPIMGSVIADLHRDHGVDVHLGVGVVRVEGGERVERIRLTDGSVLDVDVVVMGIGVAPNTAWLEDSGLKLDNGVVCNAACLAAPDVVAAGDVARWPNHRFGELMRIEHWDNAIAMGEHAARTLLAGPHMVEPFTPVPWFWSDQYDRKLQLAGRAGADDEVEVVSGSLEDRKFVALYGRAGRVVGVLGMNQPARVAKLRSLVESAAGWADAVDAARA